MTDRATGDGPVRSAEQELVGWMVGVGSGNETTSLHSLVLYVQRWSRMRHKCFASQTQARPAVGAVPSMPTKFSDSCSSGDPCQDPTEPSERTGRPMRSTPHVAAKLAQCSVLRNLYPRPDPGSGHYQLLTAICPEPGRAQSMLHLHLQLRLHLENQLSASTMVAGCSAQQPIHCGNSRAQA